MKKRNQKLIVMVAALLIVIIVIFSRCGRNDKRDKIDSDLSITTSEISEGNEKIVEASTSKYSSDDMLIALTFDDGPATSSTDKILDTLEENDAVATFFVVGYNIDKYPDRIKRAAEIGCEIGNHTKGHKTLNKISTSEMNEQVGYVNNKIKEITGKDCKLLRAPGGNANGIEDKVGMPLIQWDIDTEDWKYKDAKYPNRTKDERTAKIEQIATRVADEAKSGDIILMHDIYDFSADLAENVILKLKEKGFKMVTVSEMFEAYGQEPKAGSIYRNVQKKVSTNTKIINAGQFTVSTGGDTLNIRRDANVNSEKLGNIPNGTVLTITESKEGWAKTTYSGITGWVSTAYLK